MVNGTVCPRCKKTLVDNRCDPCALTFIDRSGFTDFAGPLEPVAAAAWPEAYNIHTETIAYLKRWREERGEEDLTRGLGLRDRFLEFCGWDRLLEGNLLDIGCKDGCLRQTLPPEVKYYGLDPLLLATADNANERLFWGYAEFLPFRDGLFDYAVAISTLDYFLELPTALAECSRVLRTGAKLFVMVSLHPLDVNRLQERKMTAWMRLIQAKLQGKITLRHAARLFKLIYFLPQTHQTYFTYAKLERVLESGFAVTAQEVIDWGGQQVVFLSAERK